MNLFLKKQPVHVTSMDPAVQKQIYHDRQAGSKFTDASGAFGVFNHYRRFPAFMTQLSSLSFWRSLEADVMIDQALFSGTRPELARLFPANSPCLPLEIAGESREMCGNGTGLILAGVIDCSCLVFVFDFQFSIFDFKQLSEYSIETEDPAGRKK